LDPSPAPLVPFLLGLAVTAGITVPSLLRLRTRSARASLELAAEQDRSAILEQMTGHLGQELRFLTEFVNDYPRLARELYSGVSERQVPAALLGIVQRSLDPQRVAVLVRRSEPRGDTAQSPRLVVAAAYPDGAAIDVGSDVPLDRGAIGFAAEAQRVIDREDLLKEAAGRVELGAALPGLPSPDFIAPLVFDQDTLGMILVQHPRRSGDAKTVLRLIAQSGAQVLHTATQVGRMKQTAEMDGLTRIHNKKHLEQVLNDLVYRAACAAYDRRAAGQPQPPPPVSVFLFDIDNFKHYNDTNGHLAGDELLRDLAALVMQSVRKDDAFGRFGGEEFLLVLPNTAAAQAMMVAEKVRALIAAHPFPFAARQPLGRLSVSGGVAEYPNDGIDAAGILHAADEALYEAKRSGRDRVFRAKALPIPAGEVAG
jgi:diguanylate cyclase (GGDEF)-like protein